MNQDKKIEERISQFQALGKEDKNVDVAKLMMFSLNEKGNAVSSKKKRWAYIVSLGLPPIGFLLALKYYFDDEDDARHVANVCVVITLAALLMVWISFKMLSSGSAGPAETELNQIQQINPKDLQDLMK
jgi:hypothetical protein